MSRDKLTSEELEARKRRSAWRKRLMEKTKQKEQAFKKRRAEKDKKVNVQSSKEVEKKNKIIKAFGGNVIDNYLKKLKGK